MGTIWEPLHYGKLEKNLFLSCTIQSHHQNRGTLCQNELIRHWLLYYFNVKYVDLTH